MAVDVLHHVSPTEAYAKMAFGQKSKSVEELNMETAYPKVALSVASVNEESDSQERPNSGSDKSSIGSLLDFSLVERSEMAVEQLVASRKKLEDEIECLVKELTEYGDCMNCVDECTQVLQDSEEAATKKMMRRGRKLFNNKPSEGIRFLMENHLLNATAEDVSLFLFVSQLDKAAIGEYMGGGKQFNIDVLHQFVHHHKFHGLDLVAALRAFLGSFQLPGEAQKIDRMMETFAKRYCECNPGTFSNTDTCYIVSFAIIMLNTSLHNANVKNKPTVEQFISMNRDINDGKSLPSELLQGYFDAIKLSPFQYHQNTDELAEVFFNPDYQGYLTKEGGKHKSWRKRWFILTDNCLYYFKSPSDKEPRGIIPLVNLEIRDCPDLKRNHVFEISLSEKIRGTTIKACKTVSNGQVVVGHHANYRIQADTLQEKEEWKKRIRASISRNPFLERLQERRQRLSHNQGPVGL